MNSPYGKDLHQANSKAAATVTRPQRPRVVIVGAGFGGLSAAVALDGLAAEVTVIDRRNYHLFQPLLYQVATAGLAPSDIASPIRAILGRQKNASVLMGKVTGIDTAGRHVELGERRLPYDFLILATGARHAYFGHDEWERYAPGLKKIDDAIEIRRRILMAFERAETTEDERERRRLLTFAIVGAGPTGVEMAGAIAELARRALARDFRRIDPRAARVMLLEAGPRILSTFPDSLSQAAAENLAELGVETCLGQAVTHCDETGITLGAEHIEAATVIWAAGVMASPAAKWLAADCDSAGRVKVNADLSLPGHPEIFVIGDTASVQGADGRPLPGVAPVAKQQGRYLARRLRFLLGKGRDPGPFHYRSFGNLATIGRRAAIADFGRIRVTGFAAWLLWGVVHIYFLIGFRNRIAVALDWIWAYLTFQRGARLITGSGAED